MRKVPAAVIRIDDIPVDRVKTDRADCVGGATGGGTVITEIVRPGIAARRGEIGKPQLRLSVQSVAPDRTARLFLINKVTPNYPKMINQMLC